MEINPILKVADKDCNLDCTYCFYNRQTREKKIMPSEVLERVVKEVCGHNSGNVIFVWHGGEPLLAGIEFYERAFGFQEKYRKPTQRIVNSIQTNGSLINEEWGMIFKQYGVIVGISLDGLEKSHDQIREKGNFRKTTNKIKILRKYCQTATLATRVTINSLNINEYKELIKLAEKLSLDLIRFTPILLFGRAKDNQDLLINQNEYIRFLENTQNIKSKIKLELPKKEERKWFASPGEFGCHCGKEVCWITQSGNFYPCIFFGDNFMVGNIRNESFLDLWTKAKNMVRLCGNEICNNCPEFKKCRGGCRARALSKYKDINAIDPLCPLKKNKP